MPACKYCNTKLYWINYKKGDRPKNNDGSVHTCGNTTVPKGKVQAGKITPDEWKIKFIKVYQWRVPVYCNMCGRSYKPTNVCDHIRQDGYVEGRDSTTFYSDNWKASKKRELLRKDKRKKNLKGIHI